LLLLLLLLLLATTGFYPVPVVVLLLLLLLLLIAAVAAAAAAAPRSWPSLFPSQVLAPFEPGLTVIRQRPSPWSTARGCYSPVWDCWKRRQLKLVWALT